MYGIDTLASATWLKCDDTPRDLVFGFFDNKFLCFVYSKDELGFVFRVTCWTKKTEDYVDYVTTSNMEQNIKVSSR